MIVILASSGTIARSCPHFTQCQTLLGHRRIQHSINEKSLCKILQRQVSVLDAGYTCFLYLLFMSQKLPTVFISYFTRRKYFSITISGANIAANDANVLPTDHFPVAFHLPSRRSVRRCLRTQPIGTLTLLLHSLFLWFALVHFWSITMLFVFDCHV